jgi:hypothetical protein
LRSIEAAFVHKKGLEVESYVTNPLSVGISIPVGKEYHQRLFFNKNFNLPNYVDIIEPEKGFGMSYGSVISYFSMPKC